MWSWIMDESGHSCDRVIGGKVATWEGGVRLDGGAHCILEGDEYPCGIGDRSPKFLHYRPEIAIITNVHFDHPDAFHSEAEVMDCYRGLLDLLPEDGLLVVNYDDKNCRELMKQSHCPVLGVGFSTAAPIRLKGLRHSPVGVTFSVEGASFHLPLAGRMNAANAAAAALAARHWGVSLVESAQALRTFPGAEGRQMFLRADDTLVLVSDTAYHPHAVGELLRAMRGRHPGRRVGLVLQPRHTAGEGNWQQRLWPRVLRHADICMITDALNPEGGPRSHFDAAKVASTAGTRVTHVGAPDRAGELFDRHLRAGDVWVLCLADWFVQPRKHITDSAAVFAPSPHHSEA
jgi:UDP-N-acetylmuramate: L-alanyl-gamma-D-glutamyl-meso-diaminopimelate ligase